MVKYKERESRAMGVLSTAGFTPDILNKFAGFTMYCGLFEINLELAMWALNSENVEGKRPTTDGRPLITWLADLESTTDKFSEDAYKVVQGAVSMARNIMDYRHGIVHGAMVIYSDSVTFIRNPLWGNVKRSKPTHDSHVDENLLDLALDCILTLYEFSLVIKLFGENNTIDSKILALQNDVGRCVSQAYDLRHLTEMVNHEKY